MRMINLKIISFCFLIIAITGEEYRPGDPLATISDETNKPLAATDAECPTGQARILGRCADSGFFNGISKRETGFTMNEEVYPDIRQNTNIDAECATEQARNKGSCIDPGFFYGKRSRKTRYIYTEVYPEMREFTDDIIDICEDEDPKRIKVVTYAPTTPWPKGEYIKRKYNPETYVYMMPKTMVFGDSLTYIATLKKNATRFQIFLINRGFEGLDFGNMPLDLAVDIGPGESNDNVSLGHHSGLLRTPVADETNRRKLIFGDRLIVMLSFRRHASSEHHFRIEVFLNGKLLDAVAYQGSLADVGFLHVSGDIIKVDRLDFKLVQPHFITT